MYWQRGWRGLLPVPARSKKIDVVGWSGRYGATPSWPDVQAWIEDRPGANIALRLPPTVLGLDVDDYDGKVGGATLAEHESLWGPLPPTWRTTSRDDKISGIRLFTIPPGLEWVGGLPGLELCHAAHRYVMAPPSIHPEGRVYRWIDPDGLDTLAVPHVADLPLLPANWLIGLSKGRYVEEQLADMPRGEIATWLADQDHGDQCAKMKATVAGAVSGLVGGGGSRHGQLNAAVLTLVRQANDGHLGLQAAIREVRQVFLDLVVGDKSRSESEAGKECERALAGAVQIVAGSPSLVAVTFDPCLPEPLSGLFARVHAEHATMAGLGGLGGLGGHPVATTDGVGTVTPDAPGLTTGRPPENLSHLPTERTTWSHGDIDLALLGQHAESAPSILARSDGVFLLYRGRINGLIGPSESGKSWVALEACRQTVVDGHHVLYLDFEDSIPGIVGRLLTLGVPPADIRQRFTYVGPAEPLGPLQAADLEAELAVVTPADLIVLDGFNAAMTLQGLNLIDNKDVTTFYFELLRVLVATGACITYVDHTPKNDAEGDSRGGIGAQAKRAMTTGTILRCDVKTPFGRNQTGYITLLVDKDRSGHVREIAPGRKVGAARFESKTVGEVNTVTITIEPPEAIPAGVDEAGVDYSRPTFLMRRVSDYLAIHPGATGRTIRQEVKGNESYVTKALAALVIEGYVMATPGLHRAVNHTLERPYLEELDRVVPGGVSVVPGTSRNHGVTGAPDPQTTSGGTRHHSSKFNSSENGSSGATAPPDLFDAIDSDEERP